MSLIAITPEYVVWDYTFVTKREELLEQPKGRWFEESGIWVLLCGGWSNEEAFAEYEELIRNYLETGVEPVIRDAEMFMQPALITAGTRAFKIYLGKFEELLEPRHSDGILREPWEMCQAEGMSFEDSCRILQVVCPTMRRAVCHDRIDGLKVGEFHARNAL